MKQLGPVLLVFAALAAAAPVPQDGPRTKARKSLRVLLVTGARGREHRFLERLLLDEARAKRGELAVVVQPHPGRKEKPRAVVEEPRPLQVLTRFPDEMASRTPQPARARPFDLGGYDVVVAVDADWGRLSEAQAKLLRRWVTERGGGLVVVAGPINLGGLAKPGGKLGAVRDLLPVVVDGKPDSRDTSRPWQLAFPAVTDRPAFLKLEPKGKGALAGWDEYFRDGKAAKKDEALERGFYSCHAVTEIRPGAVVLATFGDPKARLKGGQARPYLVVREAGKGRVIYLGSSELWRLAAYRQAYFDRFWKGLLAEAARGR
jgi:hypothetical protein